MTTEENRNFNENAEIKQNNALPMPEILSDTILTLKKNYKGCSINSITNIVLAKTVQMFTAKRIKFKGLENTGYPNHYAIVFMPSGFGKDKMSDDLDKHYFYDFRFWFTFEAQKLKEKYFEEIKNEANKKFPSLGDKKQDAKRFAWIQEELKKVRNIVLEVSDGTREGFFADAKAFKRAGFGSVFNKNSEFGSYLNNATVEQRLFLNQMFEAYSGKVTSKSIKSEGREPDIEDLPVSLLWYSDPTLFEKDLKTPFNTLMQTGLGRRSVITFMSKKEPYSVEKVAQNALKQQREYFKSLHELGIKLFKLFSAVDSGAMYALTQETYCEVFYPYKMWLEKCTDELEDTLLCKEITSRELKVLKLSCLYACINHPKVLFIHPEDMLQAIDTIEMLSADFKAFLNHKPKYSDKYDRLFNFFLENEGKEFSKTELINDHCQKLGLSRDKFRAYFDEYIDVLREFAAHKGYLLNEKPINRNSGTVYSMITMETQELSGNIIPLDMLIDNSVNPVKPENA